MEKFKVSFQYSESVFCTNIAVGESQEAVEKHYEAKYPWVSVCKATDGDIEEAIAKGMPFVKV